LELCDYRNIQGSFDKIVSIEMFEAVGHENQGEFFKVCDRLLKPGGKAVLQVITIRDDRYEFYRKNCDWIQRYIFPGGCLPSIERLAKIIPASSSFQLKSLDSLGFDYARTLHIWRERFNAAREQVLELGFDNRFIRTWNYYLSYCEAGFIAGQINVVQFALSRPPFKESVNDSFSKAA
jgi:cyclopropane-fatty-acyl-phospholipid synthase